MITGLGDYLSSLPALSFRLYPHRDLREWLGAWTLTYFIWWIAWAPFVGIFIARISKGRTIREFVAGVLLAPTAFSLIWFSVFGGMGIYEETQGEGGIASVVKEDVTTALFALLDRLPAPALLMGTALLLLFIFIVTSVDSATFVLGMFTSRGAMDPPRSSQVRLGDHAGGPRGRADLHPEHRGRPGRRHQLRHAADLDPAPSGRRAGASAGLRCGDERQRNRASFRARQGGPIPSETTEAGDSRQPGLEGA